MLVGGLAGGRADGRVGERADWCVSGQALRTSERSERVYWWMSGRDSGRIITCAGGFAVG